MLGQSNELVSDTDTSELEWHRSRGKLAILLGYFIFIWLIGLYALFSDEPITVANRIGQFLVWCSMVGMLTVVVALFYYHLILQYALSDSGFHLRTPGRTKTLRWENVKNLKWSKWPRQTSKYGAVTVILHDGTKEQGLLVDMNSFREMNREFDGHRLKTVREE